MSLAQTPIQAAVAAPPTDLRAGRRLAATVVFAASAGLLGVAAWLSPDHSGLGTHTQLALPACGWVSGLGIPCPTCGMTTAFAAAADGDLLGSMKAQPLGFLLALSTAMAAVVSAYVMATGSALGGHLVRMLGPRSGWTLLVLALVAWAYKIAAFRGLTP